MLEESKARYTFTFLSQNEDTQLSSSWTVTLELGAFLPTSSLSACARHMKVATQSCTPLQLRMLHHQEHLARDAVLAQIDSSISVFVRICLCTPQVSSNPGLLLSQGLCIEIGIEIAGLCIPVQKACGGHQVLSRLLHCATVATPLPSTFNHNLFVNLST
jgi:hypothetical protein